MGRTASEILGVALPLLFACTTRHPAPGTVIASAATTAPATAIAPKPLTPDAAGPAIAAWRGSWRGVLEILGPDGVAEILPMVLDVAPTGDGNYDWTLIYGEGEARQVRAYALRIDDDAAGRYAIDERNGIVIAMRRYGRVLLGDFAVAGSRMVVRYELEGADHLRFEIIVSRTEAATTGGTGDVPPVAVYEVVAAQRARLRREAHDPALDAGVAPG